MPLLMACFNLTVSIIVFLPVGAANQHKESSCSCTSVFLLLVERLSSVQRQNARRHTVNISIWTTISPLRKRRYYFKPMFVPLQPAIKSSHCNLLTSRHRETSSSHTPPTALSSPPPPPPLSLTWPHDVSSIQNTCRASSPLQR